MNIANLAGLSVMPSARKWGDEASNENLLEALAVLPLKLNECENICAFASTHIPFIGMSTQTTGSVLFARGKRR